MPAKPEVGCGFYWPPTGERGWSVAVIRDDTAAAVFGAAPEERWVFPNQDDVPPATWQETLDLLEDTGLSLTDAVGLAHLDDTVVRTDHLVSYVLDRMTRAYTGVSKDLAASRADWQKVFTERPGELWDEYGERVEENPIAWLDRLEPPTAKQRAWEESPAAMGPYWQPGDPSEWRDHEGFRFSDREFS